MIRNPAGEPQIFDGNTYWFAYVGYGQSIDGQQRGTIGFARTTDLADASQYVRQSMTGFSFGPSMVPGDPDSDSVSGVNAVLDGATLHLFYMGGTEPGGEAGVITMCHASAPWAGVKAGTPTWTRHGQVIGLGAAGSWRWKAIWKGRIVTKGSTYYMIFNASGDYLGVEDKERIGYATATSLNGPWTVATEPILNVGEPGEWDTDRIGDPSLERIGDVWVMDYFGNADGGVKASNGSAWTTHVEFPLGWRKHPRNPFIVPGPGVHDNVAAHKPERVREPIGQRRLIQLYTSVGVDGHPDGSTQGYGISAAVATPGPVGLAELEPARKLEVHTRGAGDVVLNGATWQDVDNGLDALLDAQIGDLIECGVNIRYRNEEGTDGHLNAFTIVGGAPVSNAGDVTNGVPAWNCDNGRYGSASGSAFIKITNADLDGGKVRVRLRGKVCVPATTKTLIASTPVLEFWARNVGRQG